MALSVFSVMALAETSEITYEVLDMPKSGILGIGAKPARILATNAQSKVKYYYNFDKF